MTPDDVQKLILRPESDILEVKARMQDPIQVARVICAFANTKGGILVVGIKGKGEIRQISGIPDPEHSDELLQKAIAKITPSINVDSEVMSIDGKHVLVVTVPKGLSSPYTIDGEALERTGVTNTLMSIYTPDVHVSAYEAVISGSNVIVTGDGAVAAGEGGIIIGGDINRAETVTEPDIPYDRAFERVVGSTSSVLSQLELLDSETRKQAQGWFRYSLIAAISGFVLIGIGVVVAIDGAIATGIITSLSGLITESVASLFFVQLRAANKRFDTINKRLTEANKILSAVDIVNTMENPMERNKLKAEIVRDVLRINP